MSYKTQKGETEHNTIFNISQWGMTSDNLPCMYLSGQTVDGDYSALPEGTYFTYAISNDGNALVITDDALPTLVYRVGATLPSGEAAIRGGWFGGATGFGLASFIVSDGKFQFWAPGYAYDTVFLTYPTGLGLNRILGFARIQE